MFSQINEKVDEIKEQKGPCLWCDATDTCADFKLSPLSRTF